MAASNKKQERISTVRFVHYFSDKHPNGTLAVSGVNFKGTFCRLIPCKIDAEGKKYGNYHNHIGGLLVTIKRLTTDKKFIRELKEEFVFGEFSKKIQGDALDLEKVNWD